MKEGSSDGDEREADNRAVGSRTSATATSIGAEKNRNDMIMVIKKNTVLIPLNTLLLFSSFKNPIILVSDCMWIVKLLQVGKGEGFG